MTGITDLGNAGVLIGAVVFASACLFSMRKNISGLIVLASLVAYPINVIIKGIVYRARPTSALIKIISPTGGYSFPSGHAMISMAVYGTIAYVIWINSRPTGRFFTVLITGLLIIAIGMSRIYLGVHWFTDVLGGWMGGTVLLLIFIEIQKKWLQKAKVIPVITPNK